MGVCQVSKFVLCILRKLLFDYLHIYLFPLCKIIFYLHIYWFPFLGGIFFNFLVHHNIIL